MSEPSQNELLTTNRKALSINLDDSKYGTFAEIGAGQETARYFFQAGGAAGTVAKTISAYDMTFSDQIYGKSKRYVSRERLQTMLEHEYELLEFRLGDSDDRHDRCFFSFANTVKTRPYRGPNDAHGWIGIRFQPEPDQTPSTIVIHTRLWDVDNLQQHLAVGILGVNLIYGAFYLRHKPEEFIESLLTTSGPTASK